MSGTVAIPSRVDPAAIAAARERLDAHVREIVRWHFDRLNVGAIPTNQISWDQPHEGNLFEHLYARRSFQRAADTLLATAAGA